MTHQLQPKFYENGQKRHERKYSEDGQKASDHYYYEDGQKESVYYYKDGKETYWHRNGQKKLEAIWKNRDRDGKKTVGMKMVRSYMKEITKTAISLMKPNTNILKMAR